MKKNWRRDKRCVDRRGKLVRPAFEADRRPKKQERGTPARLTWFDELSQLPGTNLHPSGRPRKTTNRSTEAAGHDPGATWDMWRRNHYFVPGGVRWLKYCDEYVCLFVCRSVCLSARITRKLHGRTSPNFCVHAARGRGSVVLRQRCDTLCTSGFTDEPQWSTTLFRRVRQVAVPVGRKTSTVFGWVHQNEASGRSLLSTIALYLVH